jgi:hypothetical protein
MFQRKNLTKIVVALLILALVQMACVVTTPTPAPSTGGVVQGVVYADANGSGTIDAGEGPLDAVQVTLADCGPIQSQVTAADGKFNFTNLPAGTCHVTVSKTDWIFSGSFPNLEYPFPAASDPTLPTSFSLFMKPVGVNTETATATTVFTDTPTDTPMPVSTDTPTEIPVVPTDTETPTPASNAMITPKSQDANCRFGPGTGYSSVGGLKVGVTVPITGTIADKSWWQIDNPIALGTPCWVSNAVTATSGDLSLVPVLPIPTGLVTKVGVTTPALIHGTCGGPNATAFQVTVTTNGPVIVTYHVEIYNGDGTLRNKTSDATLTFASASTQTFDPGGAYKTDCGNFKIKVLVTAPNNKSAEASWSVVSP